VEGKEGKRRDGRLGRSKATFSFKKIEEKRKGGGKSQTVTFPLFSLVHGREKRRASYAGKKARVEKR